MWYKGTRSYHVESDILKEGPGTKTPSVKMLFKTNTDGPKHPSISLIIIEQDTIGEAKENDKWYSTWEPRTQKPVL